MNGQRSNLKLVSSFIHHQELVLFCNDSIHELWQHFTARPMRNCIKAPREWENEIEHWLRTKKRGRNTKKPYDFSPFHPFTTSCWNWNDVDEAKKAPGVTVKLREPREMEEKCIFFDDDEDDDQHWGHRTKHFCMNSSCERCSVLCRKNVNVEVSVST